MGRDPADRPGGLGRGPHGGGHRSATLSDELERLIREQWWAAVATLTRLSGGDLAMAEDAVQDACAAALAQWPVDGLPPNPGGWLVSVARHKLVDRLRRETRRGEKEAAAVRGTLETDPEPGGADLAGDDELSLIFLCCHPALDPAVQVALTLRSVCGLTTAEIAAAFLVSEPTMAKRLVRAKDKIRKTGISFKVPSADALAERIAGVLRVVYLVFTEGHQATGGNLAVRADLCESALRLARALTGLLPGEPEAEGLLALILLTDARRPARTDADGSLVLLEEQDRARWDQVKIAEGLEVLSRALAVRRPATYQVQAAIAACHAEARAAEETDWAQIAALYGQLLRYEPTLVVEVNRAVAVAMAEGPAAGLELLERAGDLPAMERWPRYHLARADLLRRLGRVEEACAAYDAVLERDPAPAERVFVERRLALLRREPHGGRG